MFFSFECAARVVVLIANTARGKEGNNNQQLSPPSHCAMEESKSVCFKRGGNNNWQRLNFDLMGK